MTASWHRPGVLGDAVALPSAKPLPDTAKTPLASGAALPVTALAGSVS